MNPSQVQFTSHLADCAKFMWKLIQSQLIQFLRSGLELGLRNLPTDALASTDDAGADEKSKNLRGYGYNTLHPSHPRRAARKTEVIRLLSFASQISRKRNEDEDYRCSSLKLSPADAAGGPTNCPNATSACIAACIGGPNGGVGAPKDMRESFFKLQREKTRCLQSDRAGFIGQLMDEIEKELDHANMSGSRLAIQLNEFSDLAWESKEYGEVPQQFPDVLFWDFTRRYDRIREAPENYKLIASWTPEPKDQAQCIALLNEGYPVSIVFAEGEGRFFGWKAFSQRLPRIWTLGQQSFLVWDGDSLDPTTIAKQCAKSAGLGRICGLRLRAVTEKARQSAIASGFCVVINHV